MNSDGEGELDQTDQPNTLGTVGGSRERAGIYLAAIAALAVPSLIVLALFLPGTINPMDVEADNARRSGTSRGSVDIGGVRETTSDAGVPVDVGGAGAASDEVITDIGDAATIVADDGPADVQIAGPESPNPPTTTVPETEPAEFAQRVDFGRIGETTVQFRFMAAADSAYVATIRSRTGVVSTSSGPAFANILINETVTDLSAGTDYTVQVELTGPAPATSPEVPFRTSGGQPSPDQVDPAAVLNLRLAENGSTRFELNYESNVCANGSFVIREQGGVIVGRSAGQAAGCTTRHVAIPGFWTPPIEPNTTYVITVQVEANGAGQGEGNTASESLAVTTKS